MRQHGQNADDCEQKDNDLCLVHVKDWSAGVVE
jgi:hypothetical protein